MLFINEVLLGNNVQNDMLSKHIFCQFLLESYQICPNIWFLNKDKRLSVSRYKAYSSIHITLCLAKSA